MLQYRSWNLLNFNIFLTISLISLAESIPVKRDVTASESGRSTYQNGDLLREYFLRTISLSSAVNELLTSLDESVNPCTDFYSYTCGHWVEHHPVKPGYLTWTNMNVIMDGSNPKIESLLTANDSETDNEAIRKARQVYRACMDTAKSEAEGVEPILSILNENGGWPLIMNLEEWQSKNISWQQILPKFIRTFGTGALFDIKVEADNKNSNISRLSITEPNLVVKDEELEAPPTDPVARAYYRYKSQITSIFLKASGVSEEGLSTSAQWDEVDQFEKVLSTITEGGQDLKVIDEWYTLMTIDEFQAFYDSTGMTDPNARINWLEMVREVFSLTPDIVVDGSEEVLVPGKAYFTKLAEVLNQTSSEVIVNYIMWKIIPDLSYYANNQLKNPLIGFYRKRPGVDPIADRLSGCVTNPQMARAVAYAFITKYSSPETKQAVLEMVDNMREAMERRIQQSSWLDSETKQLAAEKIHVMGKSVSYPDYFSAANIDDYYSEFIPSDSFFQNEMQKRALDMRTNCRSLHKPTDKSIWPSEPIEINAFYLQIANSVVVPAGILQPPLFDLNKPKIFNYAGVGPIIGHEVSHALDNAGRLYNKNGDVVTWWPEAAIDKYEENTQCFVNQYSSYKIYDDGEQVIHLDGNLTLEENVSDSTGLKITWDAYKIFREKSGNTEKIPGLEKFTDDQIFFMAYGNTWCSSEDEKYLKRFGNTDEHSPAKQRVNGAVSNNAGFTAAFNCPENSPMNPANKCSIWE